MSNKVRTLKFIALCLLSAAVGSLIAMGLLFVIALALIFLFDIKKPNIDDTPLLLLYSFFQLLAMVGSAKIFFRRDQLIPKHAWLTMALLVIIIHIFMLGTTIGIPH